MNYADALSSRERPIWKTAGVTAVLGPTNTGKTHFAIERMLAHPSGMIGLPLRLLAREVYQKLSDRAGTNAVALITGEEKIKPAGARYWVSTVEAMPRDLIDLHIHVGGAVAPHILWSIAHQQGFKLPVTSWDKLTPTEQSRTLAGRRAGAVARTLDDAYALDNMNITTREVTGGTSELGTFAVIELPPLPIATLTLARDKLLFGQHLDQARQQALLPLDHAELPRQ